MVTVVGEVAKACKKIKRIIEVVDIKGHAHILHKELQVISFICLGGFYTWVGYIYAGYIIAMLCKLLCKAPFSASNIKHLAAGRRLQVLQQMLNKFLGLVFIPVLIQYLIKRRTKPVFKPIHNSKSKSAVKIRCDSM